MATHSSALVWRIPIDRGAWWAVVHGVAKSWTRLSDSHFHFHTWSIYVTLDLSQGQEAMVYPCQSHEQTHFSPLCQIRILRCTLHLFRVKKWSI